MTWSHARTLESLPTAPGKACSTAWATPSSSPASLGTGWRVRRGWSASEAGGGCGAPLCQGVLVGGHMFFIFLLSSPPHNPSLSSNPAGLAHAAKVKPPQLNYHHCCMPTHPEIVHGCPSGERKIIPHVTEIPLPPLPQHHPRLGPLLDGFPGTAFFEFV